MTFWQNEAQTDAFSRNLLSRTQAADFHGLTFSEYSTSTSSSEMPFVSGTMKYTQTNAKTSTEPKMSMMNGPYCAATLFEKKLSRKLNSQLLADPREIALALVGELNDSERYSQGPGPRQQL